MNQYQDNPSDKDVGLSPRNSTPVQAMAKSLCHHLTLDQRILLRLYGRSIREELTNDQFAGLLRSFGLEMPRRKQVVVSEIADGIETGESFIDALGSFVLRKKNRASNYRLIEQALRISHEQNSLPAFLEAVADYQPSQQPMALRYQDTVRKKLTRLAFKTFFIFQISAVIFLVVFKEFQKMFIEYGLELPWPMPLMMSISDQVDRNGVLILLILVLMTFCFLLTYRSNLLNVFAKFSPWSWLNPPLSKQRQRQLSFAISDGQSTIGQGNTKELEQPKFSRNETAALDMANSADAKTWLLDRIIQQNDQRNAVWKNRMGDSLILFWNLLLACVVAMIAFSVISCLIAIVRGLCGQ